MRVELLAVARDDAGRLLPAVLQRVQAEVRDVRGLGVPVDAEDAALVVEVVVFELDVRLADRITAVEHGEPPRS